MDDLKKYLKEVAKYSFWIVTGLVLILSAVVFFLTKSRLDTEITQRISSLESSFKKISDVSSKTSTHPNDFSHKEMDKRLEILKGDVDRAWEFQYARQTEFLTWPSEAFFQTRTREIFDSLRPFEKNVPFPLPEKVGPPLDSITENDRKVYRGFIAPEFPALARRIGSTWKFELNDLAMATGGGFAPPAGAGSFAPPGMAASIAASESRDLVRWSEDSQKQLVSAVLPWFARPTPPTIHEIYYAQEDIWILRGLMDIIAQTNAGANENFQAIVKEIEWIRTGSKASRDAGELWGPGASVAGGGGYGGGGPPANYAGGGGGGMPSGYGAAGGTSGKGGFGGGGARAAVKVDPADGRYVDTNFKPLTGAQLRAAMNLVNATDAVNAVAKRIPVRLRLKMDDRFGRFITECGNGKMILEVLQVRYNTDPAGDSSGGGSMASGGGGSGKGSERPNVGGMGGSGAGGLAGDETSGGLGGGPAATSEVAAGEVSVEIFGLIYLFNPPASLSATNAAVKEPLAGATSAPAATPSPVPANGVVTNPTGAASDTSAPASTENASQAGQPVGTENDSATPSGVAGDEADGTAPSEASGTQPPVAPSGPPAGAPADPPNDGSQAGGKP